MKKIKIAVFTAAVVMFFYVLFEGFVATLDRDHIAIMIILGFWALVLDILDSKPQQVPRMLTNISITVTPSMGSSRALISHDIRHLADKLGMRVYCLLEHDLWLVADPGEDVKEMDNRKL